VTEIGGATCEPAAPGTRLTRHYPAADQGAWFAVQTKPRHEKKLAAELESKGLEVFLPLFSALHQWSDRRRQVQMPLFANYVFVRLGGERTARVSVLSSAGAIGFVGMRGAGVSVPEDQIRAIQTLLREKIPLSPCPFLRVGQKVRIRGGSLDGVVGILAVNDARCLVVSVEGIERSLAVRIDGYGVEAV
jgi:transcription antitermination factor NusG